MERGELRGRLWGGVSFAGTQRGRLAGLAVAALALTALLALANAPLAATPGEMRIVVIDVGQGDAILVRGPDGYSALIDGGRPERCPTGYLAWAGVSRLDDMVVSNPDADHVGCLATVLRNIPTARLIHSGQEGASAAYNEFAAAVAALAVPTVIVRTGDVLTWGCCLTATILHPASVQGSINENSVVLRVSHGETHALFTGDATSTSETKLMQRWGDVQSQFLKVAHHGSATSSSADFLAAVNPQIAAISVGAGNGYGHPAPDVLARLADAGALIYRTDLSGTLTFVSDGASIRLQQAGYRLALPVILSSLLPPTPTPTLPPAADALVRIAPWCSQVDAPGNDNTNLNEEYVCFENQGSAAANLLSWYVHDDASHEYRFPAFVLAPGYTVTLRTGSGRNTATDLFWGRTQAVSNNDHDTVHLRDPAWGLVDVYAY